MRYILIVLLTLITLNASAHVPPHVYASFRRLMKLVKMNDSVAIAKMIAYPLYRPNPLPNIENPRQFLAQYSTIFDKDFKLFLSKYDDSVVFEHHFAYGLVGGNFAGEVWMYEDGQICAIRESKTEEGKLEILKGKIQCQMHSSVSKWSSNIIVATTTKLLIRVDEMDDNGYRYSAWSKGHKYNEKPDIIIYGGTKEYQGTMGGVHIFSKTMTGPM